jgi:AraC-like DNA-binding protein/quercetin dioxygenase-like cupin family protein
LVRIDPPKLTPELVDWWIRLRDLPPKIGRVHRWRAIDHPPSQTPKHHLHAIPTWVVCLAGVVRVSSDDRKIDLSPNDALILEPGVWHHHAPLRKGCLIFQQGVLRHRSDFLFSDGTQQLWAAVPEEPSLRLLTAAANEANEDRRRRIANELVTNLVRETMDPLRPAHPAVMQMEAMLWRLVHAPGGADDIVRAAGIGRAQAYRLFVEHLGTSPAAALLELRLVLARALLSAGLSVSEVATRCGFTSRQTFSRAFARHEGHPPGKPGRRPLGINEPRL